MCADANYLLLSQKHIYICTVPITLKADTEKQADKLNLLEHYLQLSQIIN